ncbi:uncharacterized protein LOC126842560 isoform X8 [Adelges cooleyi]|uniref:uncharacterized protein LOC126842560 isoform X7 n=1 Tax=Adelges cooleyi TaxID=133065 RepID=UPI00217F2A4A|nr:uncharacterized protein LOC126842560 isoform X7 [Adelges cooleyi]XP_050435549.1 uncharacterized protein LOC126842560 isoform X8 [Adelges cooleyi]
MKRFCVLIVFVAINVLAEDKLALYKKHLVITNRQIAEVNSLSPEKIAIIYGVTAPPIEKINEEDWKVLGMQKVIGTILDENAKMKKMVFMLAAPAPPIEEINEEDWKATSIQENLQEYINYQTDLQQVISKVLGIHPVRDIKNKDFENCGLKELGELRRTLTLDVTRQFVQKSVLLMNKNTEYKKDYLADWLCRLKGLLRSIRNPEAYIIEAKVEGNFCFLTGIDKIVMKVDPTGYDTV